MLGLTVTMMCGTQMTAFASGLGEEAPVAIETEAKETASEETEEVKVEAKEEKADAKEEVKTEVKEEVVTGTEVAETPVVEETEVKETVAGTEELVGLGVSVEAEAETDADTDAVPTPAPQADVEANTDTNTEAEEQADAEVTGSITGVTFGGAVDGVITLTDKDFITEDFGSYANIPITVSTSSSEGTFGIESTNSGFGLINPQDFDGDGVFTGEATVIKEDLIEAGGTKTFTGTLEMSSYKDGRFDKVVDTADFSVTVKYVADGTVTPEPEKPQPEPEKPQPDPEKPNPDGGNGGTETPDPEQPEKPDGGNGNGEGTQKPDGNEQKPDGNEQKPDDTQKPDNTQKPEEQKPVSGQQVQTDNTTNKGNAPKTGDPTTALPFVGAGLSSLGVALGAFFKKRK